MFGYLKQTAKGVCPPALWAAARWVRRLLVPAPPRPAPPEPPPPPWRALRTLVEVDAVLDRAQALANSFAEWGALLDSVRFVPADAPPPDPYAPESREPQMALSRRVSGRDGYSPEECEQLEITDWHREHPFPYYT